MAQKQIERLQTENTELQRRIDRDLLQQNPNTNSVDYLEHENQRLRSEKNVSRDEVEELKRKLAENVALEADYSALEKQKSDLHKDLLEIKRALNEADQRTRDERNRKEQFKTETEQLRDQLAFERRQHVELKNTLSVQKDLVIKNLTLEIKQEQYKYDRDVVQPVVQPLKDGELEKALQQVNDLQVELTQQQENVTELKMQLESEREARQQLDDSLGQKIKECHYLQVEIQRQESDMQAERRKTEGEEIKRKEVNDR